MGIKRGDMIVIDGDMSEMSYAMVVQTMTVGKKYEVCGFGQVPAGFPANPSERGTGVYLFDDIGQFTQLDMNNVKVVSL